MKTNLLTTFAFLFLCNFVQAQISKANLLVHYKLDGNGIDSSGNDQNATAYNTMGATDRFGKVNGATYFNGVDGYMLVPASATLQPADSISICVWVNQELKTNIGWSPILDKRYDFLNDPWSSYGIATHPSAGYDNKWMFAVSSGTTASGKMVIAKNPNPYNTWTFIVGTYNRNQVKLFINGVLDSALSKTGPMGYSSLGLFIGYSGTGPNEYYKGKMDDLRIYGRILSNAEILSLYGASNALPEQDKAISSWVVYPNPVTHSIRIDTDINWQSATIYDVMGKLIWQGNFEKELELDFLESGHYLLSLEDKQHNQSSRRFVKL